MKITREESKKSKYPYYGKSEAGNVVYYTAPNTGVLVGKGFHCYEIGKQGCIFEESFYTPIGNPFEDNKKFKPIKIVLETSEEFHAMLHAMGNEDAIKNQDWKKLDNLVKNNE
jgi:hypothetical protein